MPEIWQEARGIVVASRCRCRRSVVVVVVVVVVVGDRLVGG